MLVGQVTQHCHLSLAGTAGDRCNRGQEPNGHGRASQFLQEPCSPLLLQGMAERRELPPCTVGLSWGGQNHTVGLQRTWAGREAGSLSGRSKQTGHLPVRHPSSYLCPFTLWGGTSCSYSTWLWIFLLFSFSWAQSSKRYNLMGGRGRGNRYLK